MIEDTIGKIEARIEGAEAIKGANISVIDVRTDDTDLVRAWVPLVFIATRDPPLDQMTLSQAEH